MLFLLKHRNEKSWKNWKKQFSVLYSFTLACFIKRQKPRVRCYDDWGFRWIVGCGQLQQ